MMSKAVKTYKRKINGAVVAIIVLSVCLAVSAFALAYETLVVDSNVFRMGTVKININDGVPVISEGEYLFEPGMTVIKDFFVENQSTWDVYYRLYFTNVQGDLADILEHLALCSTNYIHHVLVVTPFLTLLQHLLKQALAVGILSQLEVVTTLIRCQSQQYYPLAVVTQEWCY